MSVFIKFYHYKKIILSFLFAFIGFASFAEGVDIKYEGNVTIGCSFASISLEDIITLKLPNTGYIPSIETVHGAAIGKYFFAGVGTGFYYLTYSGEQLFYSEKLNVQIGSVPLFAEFKGAYPISNTLKPFVMVDLGYDFIVSQKIDNDDYDDVLDFSGGFCSKFGAGIEYKRVLLALGYYYQNVKIRNDRANSYAKSFFFKFGVSF